MTSPGRRGYMTSPPPKSPPAEVTETTRVAAPPSVSGAGGVEACLVGTSDRIQLA